MPRFLIGTLVEFPPPPASKNGGGGGGHHANFDTNMVIILAALLCSLLCALGLNSIVRCALRCGRRIPFETPEAAAARMAATGLKKKVLRKMPVEVYRAEGASIPAVVTDCPICLGEFADGEKVRVLPKCNHGFHVRCIDTWLATHSSCPTCRNSLLNDKVTGATAVAVVVDRIWNRYRISHLSSIRQDDSVSSFQLFLCGFAAGTCAKAVCHPLDVVKKRFQLSLISKTRSLSSGTYSPSVNSTSTARPNAVTFTSLPDMSKLNVSENPNSLHQNAPPFYHLDMHKSATVMDSNTSSNGSWGTPGRPEPSIVVQGQIGFILRALHILKTEKIAPTKANIADCIHYGEINIQNFDVNLALCHAIEHQIVLPHKYGDNLLYVGKNDTLWKCVNIVDANVKHPKKKFDAVLQFLSSTDGRAAILASQCRYQAALILKRSCFKNVGLGEILQILHVIIQVRKWIVPHSSGWLPLCIIVSSNSNANVMCFFKKIHHCIEEKPLPSLTVKQINVNDPRFAVLLQTIACFF